MNFKSTGYSEGNKQQTGYSYKTGDDFINTYTLKDRVNDLEHQVSEIITKLNLHKNETNQLIMQKFSIEEMLKTKGDEVDTTLSEEINKVNMEIEKHVHHQNIENKRIWDLITKVKTDNTALTNKLKCLHNRLDEIWRQVGLEIVFDEENERKN